jgi:hypothetical protein
MAQRFSRKYGNYAAADVVVDIEVVILERRGMRRGRVPM